jgi:hypothetical protein
MQFQLIEATPHPKEIDIFGIDGHFGERFGNRASMADAGHGPRRGQIGRRLRRSHDRAGP